MMKFLNLAKKYLLSEKEDGNSLLLKDESVIRSYLEKEDSTVLVSFPRTGSHWLRMMMELYFERPSLVRIFYHYDNNEYLTLHTHDMDFDVEHPRVVYLYRDPVDTVYSQINYEKENPFSDAVVIKWSEYYAKHLEKWLINQSFTKDFLVITYEGLKSDMNYEFKKLSTFFNTDFDESKVEGIIQKISKDEVKEKTKHDKQVINRKSNYSKIRQDFRDEKARLIWENVQKQNSNLLNHFEKNLYERYLK